ncbi:MAG: YczE/YyaS/YitT family protein [Mycobacteriales bacterium]
MSQTFFVPLEDRPIQRLLRLAIGLFAYGVSLALLVRANLGLDPWDVFHQGVAHSVHRSLGTIVIATSVVVLLGWIPLRQWPGVGTLANAVAVGVFVDLALGWLPSQHHLAARIGFLIAGIVGNALATGLYIGAGLGPGPRDGLMTGLAAHGVSIRIARTCIEVTVLVIGAILGGTFGIGTVLYAVSIGPLVHILLPRLAIRAPNHKPRKRLG